MAEDEHTCGRHAGARRGASGRGWCAHPAARRPSCRRREPLGITPPDRAAIERAHYLAVRALDIAPDDQLAPGTYLEAFVDAPAERTAEACAAVEEVRALACGA